MSEAATAMARSPTHAVPAPSLYQPISHEAWLCGDEILYRPDLPQVNS